MFGGKTHAIDQKRINRRTRDARDGSEKQRTQLARFEASMMQRAAQRLFSQFLRNLDPGVVGLAPGVQLGVLLGRQRQMTPLHRYIAMQPRQHLRISQLVAPILLQLFQQEFLRSSNSWETRSRRWRFAFCVNPGPGMESAPSSSRASLIEQLDGPRWLCGCTRDFNALLIVTTFVLELHLMSELSFAR